LHSIISAAISQFLILNSQFINIPIAIRTPISSILREVSPNMLFNFFTAVYFHHPFPGKGNEGSDKVVEEKRRRNDLHGGNTDREEKQ